MTQPLKRHKSLQRWSRDHHHGLLLCWKIRKGFSIGITPERIKKYTDWFWKHHLIPHFDTEERYLFPILGNDHPLVKQALEEHRQLKILFEKNDAISERLSKIESVLNNHIRFEERVLFQAIQEVATPDEIKLLESVHQELEVNEVWEDEYWN